MNLYPKLEPIIEVFDFDVDNYFLVCDVLETECFSHHYHVYEVSRPSIQAYFVTKPSAVLNSPIL